MCGGCPKSAVERLREKLASPDEPTALAKLASAKITIPRHSRIVKGRRQDVDTHTRSIDLRALIAESPRSGGGPSAGRDRREKSENRDAPAPPPSRSRERQRAPGKSKRTAPHPRTERPEGVRSGSGTKEDPYVTDDVDVAARLIWEDQQTEEQESRYVKLDQPRQVSTLLDRLKEMVDEAKEKGDKKKGFYDLCKVSVPGTNLFCAETKGIPRIKMPQLGGVPTPGSAADDESKFPKDSKGEVNLADAFVQHLADEHGVTVDIQTTRADYLKATQNELNGGKVAGMAGAIEAGSLDPEGEAIFVSNDDYVVDGHHRWAATVAAQFEGRQLNLKTRRIDTDIISILKIANDWTVKMGMAQAAA